MKSWRWDLHKRDANVALFIELKAILTHRALSANPVGRPPGISCSCERNDRQLALIECLSGGAKPAKDVLDKLFVGFVQLDWDDEQRLVVLINIKQEPSLFASCL